MGDIETLESLIESYSAAELLKMANEAENNRGKSWRKRHAVYSKAYGQRTVDEFRAEYHTEKPPTEVLQYSRAEAERHPSVAGLAGVRLELVPELETA